MTEELHKSPIPGIPIEKPENTPKANQILVGYKLVPRTHHVFTQPEPQKMNVIGWASVIGLALFFWPLSCVPCCLSCSYPEFYQIPVYRDA